VADPLFLPPQGPISQGDLFLDMPSTRIDSRPVRAVRPLRTESGGIQSYTLYAEGAPPARGTGFDWTVKGEQVIARGHLRYAIVVSHSCDIDWEPRHLTLAMVRPITDMDKDHRDPILSGEQECTLPLQDQEDPRVELSFIDFRRLTTIHPDVLKDSKRHASASDKLRALLSEQFWDYLFRGQETERAAR